MPIDPAETTKPSRARTKIWVLIEVPAAREVSLLYSKSSHQYVPFRTLGSTSNRQGSDVNGTA